MDNQQLFNMVFAIAGALGGWWMKAMWEGLKDLQKADQKLSSEVSDLKVLVAGGITSSIGITSVTKTGTGTYDVVLARAASAANNLIVDASPYSNLRASYATITAADTLTVTTTTVGGAAEDAAFVLTVWNVSP